MTAAATGSAPDRADGLDGLQERGAGGQDVVHEHDALVRRQRPAAAQGAAARLDRLGERSADRATELASRLEGEQHATGRRPHHQRGSVRRKRLSKAAAYLHAVGRVLEDQELFEVAAGVPPRLQDEVAVQERAGIGEEGLHGGVAKGRIGHSYTAVKSTAG